MTKICHCHWLAILLPAAALNMTAAESIALRAENFLVLPTSGPLASVCVRNLESTAYRGRISLQPPAGWKIAPEEREVSLQAGETIRINFAVENARLMPGNRYPVEARATGAGKTITRRQSIVVASAPYFSPTIDGDTGEWKDAIPVQFERGGKPTTISTYWNRRQFALLIAVQEDRLVRCGQAPEFDAVQVAIAAADAVTGDSAEREASRFEFLLVAAADGQGRCYQLAAPGMKLAEAAKARSLDGLACEEARVAVSRTNGVTYYECALPFGPMRDRIRPTEGREFRLSFLIHDPDGTGIRDWGEAAGLWPSQRNPLAWCKWEGARWGREPPFDSKVEWGLCSSRY